jgi:hypothetical protein
VAELHQQAESLLESARAIASARVVSDSVDGLRIHVLATSEMSRGEVARLVKTLLEEGIGLDVRLDQITVVQSRLSEEELNRVLGRTSSSTSPASPNTSPAKDMTHGPDATGADSSPVVSRLTLVDLHVVSTMGGKQEVGVRIAGGGGSVDGRSQVAGGGQALLRPLAQATLDAVARLTQRGRRRVALVLKDVRRFRRRGDEGVVVLVEAKVNGSKTLLSGAAFSADSFERASVVAVLQATNALVGGGLEVPHPMPPDPSAPSDAPRPSDSSKRSDSPKPTDSLKSSDSSTPSDSPTPSDSSKALAPDDYVSEVLWRIQSTPRVVRTPPPSG